MTKLERAWANELELRRHAGTITRWMFEPFKLRLAKGTTYSPDFLVVLETHMQVHEVKAHWEDDARAKWKVAAAAFPEFEFIAVRKDQGRWVAESYDRLNKETTL